MVLLGDTGGPQDASGKKVDAILSVKLVRLADNLDTGLRPVDAQGGSGLPQIVYRGPTACRWAAETEVVMLWTITSLDGKRVYFSDIRGEGQGIIRGVTPTWKSKGWKQAYQNAFENQQQNAREEIMSSNWWKTPSWR